MHRIHIHMPDRMHLHRPSWHALRIHLGQMVHDPRFWATLVLIILFGLMVLTTLLTSGGAANARINYPYNPYWP